MPCAEEAPLWASVTVAFEDDAVGLVLGAIVDQESDNEQGKKNSVS